jgi:L-ascorbate 6-phosphate lactonase
MDRTSKTKVEQGRVAIHWLGQGGFTLKSHGGDLIYIDPYLSDSANADGTSPRMVDIPIKPKDVRLNYLFLTHDHADHTDPHSAPVIAQMNPDATVICPPSSCHHLTKLGVPSTQLKTAMPGQTLAFPNFTVHVVAAQHSEDSVGFVFDFSHDDTAVNGPIVYLVGDSAYYDGLASAVADYGPDVLLVPINGQWGNMSVEEAVKLTLEIEPREVVPMHYGMFESNTADPDDFVGLLASALAKKTEIDITPVVMKHNTCHVFCSTEAAQGRQARKHARAERARQARLGHEHKDGVRGHLPSNGPGPGRARLG